MYAYVAFLIVLLTYGMETAFFRLTTRKDASPNTYSTVVTSIVSTTAIFIALACFGAEPIAKWLRYPNNSEFVIWFAFIVGLDAISSIPLARLRKENKAVKFALANFLNVGTNIGLNLFFLAYCLPKYNAGETNFLIDTFYNPELGVSYVFISNLIASTVKFAVLSPLLLKGRFKFEKAVFKKALIYGLPLLFAGMAGMVNETIDRILLKRMLFPEMGELKTMTLIGIYGACYKISIIITLFIQAFRYAAEPFFFNQEKVANAKDVYVLVMNYFIIVCSFIFLLINLFIDQVKYFIPNPEYWEGLTIVPILLLANIFLGIYYNLAIWYKLTDKTMYGAIISVFGAMVTLILNIILIPKFNYVGSAWATLICYSSMCAISYYFGRKYFRINYNIKKIFSYLMLSIALTYLAKYLSGNINYFFLNFSFISLFIAIIVLSERQSFKSFLK